MPGVPRCANTSWPPSPPRTRVTKPASSSSAATISASGSAGATSTMVQMSPLMVLFSPFMQTSHPSARKPHSPNDTKSTAAGSRGLVEFWVVDAQWICDACGWDNPGTRVCERCGQALHWQQDPPLDMPGAPSPAMLPEFWSFLLWTVLSLAGVVVTLLPVGTAADIPWYWLAVHLLVFGTASLGALRNLMFSLWFYRVDFSTPAHARSGTMID